jgi:hypothetical protein
MNRTAPLTFTHRASLEEVLSKFQHILAAWAIYFAIDTPAGKLGKSGAMA